MFYKGYRDARNLLGSEDADQEEKPGDGSLQKFKLLRLFFGEMRVQNLILS